MLFKAFNSLLRTELAPKVMFMNFQFALPRLEFQIRGIKRCLKTQDDSNISFSSQTLHSVSVIMEMSFIIMLMFGITALSSPPRTRLAHASPHITTKSTATHNYCQYSKKKSHLDRLDIINTS